MKLKKIKLINWQAHRDLLIDLHSDINMITGLTNAGKSCIRRAIDWICFNLNISEKDYRTEGTKETSVTIWTDTGYEVERVRSNTVNRYILRQDSEEDKIFDAVGKNIPEEVLNVLEVKPIEIDGDKINLNIAQQLTLPFLLDKPASFRAKLFNKFTGNELLDTLFKDCNKESLRLSKEVKRLDAESKDQESQIANYTIELNSAKEKLEKIQLMFSEVEKKNSHLDYLNDLKEGLFKNKEALEFVQFQKSKIKTIDIKQLNELKTKAVRLNELKILSQKLTTICDNISSVKSELSKIKCPKINFEDIKNKIKNLEKMNDVSHRLEMNNHLIETYTKQKSDLTTLYGNLKSELDTIWKECPTCPLCGQEK